MPDSENSHAPATAKRYLVVSYYLYPDTAVGARRPSELMRFLHERGCEAAGLAVGARGREGADADLAARLEGFRVMRVPLLPSVVDWLWRQLKRFRPGRPSTTNKTRSAADGETTVDTRPTKAGMLQSLRDAYNGLYGLFDAKKSWVLLSAMRLLPDRIGNRYDIVISSGPPSAAHIVGRFAAGFHNARYIMDFRDPWLGNSRISAEGNRTFWERLESWAERYCIARTDLVLCTTPGIKTMLGERYPQRRESMHVIFNGYDGEPQIARPGHPARLDMLYAGTLYLNRNPFPLLEAVRQVVEERPDQRHRVSLTFVGDCGTWKNRSLAAWASDNNMADIVRLLPRRPPGEIADLVERSSVLINLAQGQRRQIPAKTFEQLATGKMTVVVAEPDSDTAALVSKFSNCTLVDPDSKAHAVESLRNLFKMPENAGARTGIGEAGVEEYSRLAQFERLWSVLSKL